MRAIRNAILFVVPLVLLLSCSKSWLDEKPNKTQNVPSTLKDYQAMLNNTNVINAGLPALIEVASDDHYISESVWSSSTSINARNAYTWSQEVDYNLFYPWTTAYSRLYYLNFILDELGKYKYSDSFEKKQLENVRSQALFIKAETYYWLAQHYSQPYWQETADSDQGVVVQASSDFTMSVTRVSAKDTYDMIVRCLREAMDVLPVVPKVPTQANLPAAYALLSRTYLIMGQYDSAKAYADRCLSINGRLLDYSKLSPTANFIGQFNEEVLFHDQFYTAELGSFITTGCLVSREFFDSYDNNDLRKTIFFRVNGANITFKGTYNNNASNLFCGLATDEVYLIRAECNARSGNVLEAMKDLNDLLRTRWAKVGGVSTYKDQVVSDATEALVKIIEERRKELILRGLRWGDLRRLNRESRFKITLTREIGGKEYILEPNSHKYTFPVPVDILQTSGVPQTSGWNK